MNRYPVVKPPNFKLITTLICLLWLGIFTLQQTSAQTTTVAGKHKNSKNTELSKQKAENKTTNKANSQTADEKNPLLEKLPYYNYKGLCDINAARTAWAIDYPEEFAKLNGQSTTKAANAQNQKPADENLQKGKLPNSDRILPKNYDDSKTNNKPKE